MVSESKGAKAQGESNFIFINWVYSSEDYLSKGFWEIWGVAWPEANALAWEIFGEKS